MEQTIKDRILQIGKREMPEGYVKSVVGIVPADWKHYTFGDIYSERKEPGNENLPLLMVSIHSGVSDGKVDEDKLTKRTKQIEDKSQYKKAVTGDLVLNMMRAWQGAIGTVRTTGMVSPAYIVAEPDDKIYPPFMDYFTRIPRMINQIDRQSYGVTDFRKRLYWASFIIIDCILPPIEEQQKIAAILTTQDKVIELKEKRLAEKLRQKKYLMQQLLTGKKRLPGFTFEVEETNIKAISTYSVSTISQTTLDSYEGKRLYPVFNANSIGGYVDFYQNKCPYVSIIKDGAGIGRVRLCEAKSSTIGTMGCIHARKGISIIFLYYLLEQVDFGKYSNGSTIPHLYYKDYSCEKVRVPDLQEQTAIAQVLSTADREISLLRQDIEQEKQKKKALMQLLLTGIVRVNV
jgi:type I restriction enzyme S subunit